MAQQGYLVKRWGCSRKWPCHWAEDTIPRAHSMKEGKKQYHIHQLSLFKEVSFMQVTGFYSMNLHLATSATQSRQRGPLPSVSIMVNVCHFMTTKTLMAKYYDPIYERCPCCRDFSTVPHLVWLLAERCFHLTETERIGLAVLVSLLIYSTCEIVVIIFSVIRNGKTHILCYSSACMQHSVWKGIPVSFSITTGYWCEYRSLWPGQRTSLVSTNRLEMRSTLGRYSLKFCISKSNLLVDPSVSVCVTKKMLPLDMKVAFRNLHSKLF